MSLESISEEQLSDLISALMSWIDDKDSRTLSYGGISLKGALERYFYFSSVNQPENLRPLLVAASEWRDYQQQDPLTLVYDEWLRVVGRQSIISFLRRKLKNAVRYWYSSRSATQEDDSTTLISNKIGFFAINRRFVNFFKGYAEACGKDRTVFFCPDIATAEAARDLEFAAIEPDSRHIDRKSLAFSWMHPLFEPYWVSVNSYVRFNRMLSINTPAVMVFAEGTSMEDALMAAAAKARGIPTVRLQSGRAGILHVGYRNMPFDKMLCWGEGFVERYKLYTPRAEYIVTGSSLTDGMNLSRALDRKKLTFCIFTQPISKYINQSDYQALVAIGKDLLDIYPTLHLMIRKHPVDAERSMDALEAEYPGRVTMADTNTWSLNRVMQVSDIAIGFYSTTLSEASACGVIPVILKLKDSHSVFPYPERYGAALEVDNVNDATQAINQLLNDKEQQLEIQRSMQEFSHKFFGPKDGDAMKRTVASIYEAAGF